VYTHNGRCDDGSQQAASAASSASASVSAAGGGGGGGGDGPDSDDNADHTNNTFRTSSARAESPCAVVRRCRWGQPLFGRAIVDVGAVDSALVSHLQQQARQGLLAHVDHARAHSLPLSPASPALSSRVLRLLIATCLPRAVSDIGRRHSTTITTIPPQGSDCSDCARRSVSHVDVVLTESTSLRDIARRHGVRVGLLRALNGIAGGSDDDDDPLALSNDNHVGDNGGGGGGDDDDDDDDDDDVLLPRGSELLLRADNPLPVRPSWSSSAAAPPVWAFKHATVGDPVIVDWTADGRNLLRGTVVAVAERRGIARVLPHPSTAPFTRGAARWFAPQHVLLDDAGGGDGAGAGDRGGAGGATGGGLFEGGIEGLAAEAKAARVMRGGTFGREQWCASLHYISVVNVWSMGLVVVAVESVVMSWAR
jgi:hypothetical protein